MEPEIEVPTQKSIRGVVLVILTEIHDLAQKCRAALADGQDEAFRAAHHELQCHIRALVPLVSKRA